MKQRTENFKTQICTYGKEQDIQIIYNDTILTSEDINVVTFYYNARLLKSVMKGVNIDSDVNIPTGTEFILKYGLYVNGDYEYLTLGTFIVKNNEKQEDTNSYLLECYDRLLPSMVDYTRLNIIYPITVRNYIKAICEHLGLQFKNVDDVFPNYDKIIYNELYLDTEGNSIGYTFRDVLDELSQVTAGIICIDEESGQVEIRTIKETGDEIDENFFNDVNVNFGKKFGPINSVVLSRSDADNIFKQNEASVALNGLCEVKIIDNQIMNWDDRDEYLPDLLEALDGIEYYLNDFSSTGIIYYDLLDRYTVKIGENTYSCVMFNDEINIEQGIEEIIYTKIPEESETDYKSADKTDRRINQTIFRVNKQEQKIQSLITQVGDRSEKTTSITEDIDGINAQVSNIVDITNTIEGTSKIEIIDAKKGQLLELHIYGNNTVFKRLFVSPETYVGTGALLKGKSRIKVTNENGNIKYYDIPIEKGLKQNGEVYDEFVIMRGKSQLIQRISDDGVVLVEPIITDFEEIKILLDAGKNTIEIVYYSANMSARYVTQTEFTDIYATKVEMNSAISESATKIEANVTKIVTDETQVLQEQISELEITTGNISLEVSEATAKTEELEQTTENLGTEVQNKISMDEIIAKLNLAIEEGQGIIEISGNQVIINSDKFKLTKDGNITATAGNIAGLILDTNEEGNSWLFKNSTKNDGTILQNGLYIAKNSNGNNVFLYAGVDVTSGSNTLNNANTYITENGLIKAKWFEVNGESGHFYVNYDSGRRALNLTKDALSWWLDNDSNNTFAKLETIATNSTLSGIGITLRDAFKFGLYDSLHLTGNGSYRNILEIYRIDPNSSYWQKDTAVVEIYADVLVSGTRENGVNHTIWISDGDEFWEIRTAKETSSDRRLKDNIKNSTISALEIINKIKHRSFEWKKDKKHVDIGYIAQELEEINPNFVNHNLVRDTYSINDFSILSTATKAIQELSIENKQLETKLEEQQKTIDFLVNKLGYKDELKKIKEG